MNRRLRPLVVRLGLVALFSLTACGGAASTPTLAPTAPPATSVAAAATNTVAPTAPTSTLAAASTAPTVVPSTAPTTGPTAVPASPTRAAAPATPAGTPAGTPRAAATPIVGPGGTVINTYTLADIPLATAQNSKLPNSITNDRKLLLGGIGSDLWRGANDAPNEYWMVTDRGPNGQIRVDNANRRTFPVPDFTPLIIKVRVEGTGITIVETIPIVGQSGKPVTGLSNQERDEPPYDFSAQQRLPLNPNGLDTEGLVRTANGEFWLVDEYSPSLLKVDANGKVVKRWVPEGIKLTGTDYPVAETLPAIYGKRKGNRGFEGIGLSPDGKFLAIALQSPLLNPDTATGNASRNTRILIFDIASEKVTAEYAYQFEDAAAFDPKAPKADEMKLSGVVVLNATTLLIEERTDNVARLYLANLTGATNLLDSKWNEAVTRPTLEALASFTGSGVTPLAKTLAVDLGVIRGVPSKIEGIAVIDKNTIAIANDNDFDIGEFDGSGNNKGAGAKSQILIIRLERPLP